VGYGGSLEGVDLAALESDVRESLEFLRHEGKSSLNIAIFAAEEQLIAKHCRHILWLKVEWTLETW